MNTERVQMYAILLFVLVIILFTGHQLTIFEIASLFLFFFILIKFTYELGDHLSIKNVVALLMVLQWLLGAVLSYVYAHKITMSYSMAVDQSEYFGYVLPATCAFILGLFIKTGRGHADKVLIFSTNIDYYKKGQILIILGFFFEYLPGFGFLGYLLAALKYIGTFYMLITPNKKKYYWLALSFGHLFIIRSLGSGMFHEMLLWSCFLMMLLFYFNKKSIIFRFSVIVIGFFSIVIIQIIKPDYRSQITFNQGSSKLGIFMDMVKKKTFGDQPLFTDEAIANNIVRINQGWIISNVMDYIPAQKPFANGQTIQDAIIASIFPRFVFPNKPVAGGKSNMENYAGIQLNEDTSMDISQVGEAYANFGVFGGIIMMFILGLFFNWVIGFIEKKYAKYPELVFWVPLIFLQVVKAETSLVTILNHLVKAAIITWFFFSPIGNKIVFSYFLKKKQPTLH